MGIASHAGMSEQARAKSLDVVVLVGSLRKASLSRKVARALIGLAKPPLALTLVEIGNVPLYNEDEEGQPPAGWTELRARVRACHALLFVTPEYNRSVPAALKNALDVGSRPQGQNVWNGKPGGVVSVTPYALGGFGANHHLRQALVYLNVPTLQQPEAYISHAADAFDAHDQLKSAETREFLSKFIVAFSEFATKLA
jgi:chromate reductase